MRDCIDEGTLQAWFDGELPADTAAHVTSHVNTCAHCADELATLKAENSVLATTMAAEFTQPVPTERLRQQLEARITALNAPNRSKVSAPRWTLSSLFAFRGLAYGAAAALILLAAIIGLISLKKNNPSPKEIQVKHQNSPEVPPLSPSPEIVQDVNPPNPPSAPRPRLLMKRNAPPQRTNEPSFVKQERDYQTTIARLNETFQSKPPLRPSLRVEYEYNLALIDNAITATRDVARKNPKDPHAAQFMLAAYQSKVDLMNQFDEIRGLEK